jgi:hypothetical protein
LQSQPQIAITTTKNQNSKFPKSRNFQNALQNQTKTKQHQLPPFMPSKRTKSKPIKKNNASIASKATGSPVESSSTLPISSEKSNIGETQKAIKKRPAQPIAESSNKRLTLTSDSGKALAKKKEQLK